MGVPLRANPIPPRTTLASARHTEEAPHLHNAVKHIGFCSSLMARQDKRASTLADHSVSTRPLLATTNKGILVKDALMKMHPCVGLASSPDHRRQAALCQNPHLCQSLEQSV